MKRNLARSIIGGLSFTSALFIFQACYGTPQDMMADYKVEGRVLSASTGLPIEGIKVSAHETGNVSNTNSQGKFLFYVPYLEQMNLLFEDTDGTANGSFASSDTALIHVNHPVYVEMSLEEL